MSPEYVFTPTLLLILPILLLIIAAILDMVFKKGKTPKSQKEITSLLTDHKSLYSNFDLSFADNIEQKLNDLISQVSGGAGVTGLNALSQAKEFYESRIRDISAYARNPQAFGGYRLAENRMPNDIIGTYEGKIRQAISQLNQVQDALDPNDAVKKQQATKTNIEGIKKEISEIGLQLKNIVKFEIEKFPKIEKALKDTSGEAGQDSWIPLIPVALGILIGIYVIATRLESVFWFL